MNKLRFAVLAAVAIIVYGCATAVTAKPAAPGKAVSILFVGNSLTYTNNLPGLVAEAGKARGILIETSMLAYPNYALEDHWNAGSLQQLVQANHYDYVVLQQGPSSQEDGRQSLLYYGKKIKALCLRQQSKLAFYMVWPARENYDRFDGVIKNYTDAARENDAVLCPAGQVWKAYIDSTKIYAYYGPDMFHPSQDGSEAAARVIFTSLFP